MGVESEKNERPENNSIINLQEELERKINFRLSLTNARSLWGKMPSVFDCFEELEIDIMLITETWFFDCAALDELVRDAEFGEGIGMINHCRKKRGRANNGGGVAILYKKSKMRVVEYKIRRKGHEIVVAKIKMQNNTRPLFVVTVYLSTRLKSKGAEEALRIINECIHKIKTENAAPFIALAGDFNRWDCARAFQDFDDIQIITTAPTRGTATLDVLSTNFNNALVKQEVLHPLKNEETGAESDHDLVLFEFAMEHVHEFEKQVYWSRNMSKLTECADYINNCAWSLPDMSDPDRYVESFHGALLEILDRFLPLKKHVRKSTDLPWFNDGIKKKMKQRRSVFRDRGRIRDWKELKARCTDMLEQSREQFYDREVQKMTGRNNIAYGAIKALKDVDAPSTWKPTHLRPGKSEEAVGEEMVDYYAAISQEFSPLDTNKIPKTYDCERQQLGENDVVKAIKDLKLPKSYVTYDPPPALIKPCAKTFAKLLLPVLNAIGTDFWWPAKWKKEEVTVIPKKAIPEGFDDCRNISCTSVFSKLAETFMVEEIRNETKMADNQYGGSKGSGTAHLLCDLTTTIMEELEEGDKAVSLMAVDFAKAFNRMCHNHCVAALAAKGASNRTLSKVAAFLGKRTMQIRQGVKLSSERPTPGGAPQGTKSGNLLFSISADHIGEQRVERPTTVRKIPEYDGTARDLETSLNVNYYDTRERRGTRRLEDTIVEEEWECHEIETALGIESSLHRMKNFKYVDDLTVLEVNSLRSACGTMSTVKESKQLHSQGLQLQLGEIGSQASEIGMMLHPRKTQLVCISPAVNSNVTCYLRNGEERLMSGDELKILGYHLGTRPNADA